MDDTTPPEPLSDPPAPDNPGDSGGGPPDPAAAGETIDNEGDAITLEHGSGWEAFERVGQWLTADDWKPQQVDGTTAWRSGFAGNNGRYRVIAHVNVELDQLYCYAYFDAIVPEGRRGAVAEFIARANYGMRIGNFEIDMNDGELRYKSSLDFRDATLTDELLRNAIYPACTTLDRYVPGLMAVSFANSDPAEAVRAIESPPEPPPTDAS
jgi:hypothetical protein